MREIKSERGSERQTREMVREANSERESVCVGKSLIQRERVEEIDSERDNKLR